MGGRADDGGTRSQQRFEKHRNRARSRFLWSRGERCVVMPPSLSWRAVQRGWTLVWFWRVALFSAVVVVFRPQSPLEKGKSKKRYNRGVRRKRGGCGARERRQCCVVGVRRWRQGPLAHARVYFLVGVLQGCAALKSPLQRGFLAGEESTRVNLMVRFAGRGGQRGKRRIRRRFGRAGTHRGCFHRACVRAVGFRVGTVFCSKRSRLDVDDGVLSGRNDG